jgi:hypothetical protein
MIKNVRTISYRGADDGPRRAVGRRFSGGVAQYAYEAMADAILTYYPNPRELLSYLRAP